MRNLTFRLSEDEILKLTEILESVEEADQATTDMVEYMLKEIEPE